MFIRAYRTEDYAAIIDICRLTGDGGQDATPRLEHPELMGVVWAAPYLEYEPELALVIEDAGEVVGYALGAADTVAFEKTLNESWWPALQQKYPTSVAEQTAVDSLDRLLIKRIHSNPTTDQSLTSKWPAHLHVDLLPVVQGKGLGRKIMDDLMQLLADAGASGVHLGVDPRNTGAIGFYERLGFDRLSPDSAMFTRDLP